VKAPTETSQSPPPQPDSAAHRSSGRMTLERIANFPSPMLSAISSSFHDASDEWRDHATTDGAAFKQ
jgi:hypothetical protein